MTTAADIIASAYRLFGMPGEGASLSAQEQTDGLEVLNQVLSGVCKTERVLAVGTAIPIPMEYEEDLRYVLASRLAPEYEAQLTPLSEQRAMTGESVLRGAAREPVNLKFDPIFLSPRYDIDKA